MKLSSEELKEMLKGMTEEQLLVLKELSEGKIMSTTKLASKVNLTIPEIEAIIMSLTEEELEDEK